MFEKKKLDFWRLAFAFCGITILILFILWSTPQANTSKMMDKSMGNMMKSMHTSNITIYDLLNNSNDSQNMSEMSSHHSGQTSTIFKLSFISTAVIYFLLPLIVGGAVLLAIVWFK